MPPESEDYLSIARRDLDDAKTILNIGIARVAARSAYFVTFHAAEAVIFGLTGKIAKTHSGVHSEYARFSRDLPISRTRLMPFSPWPTTTSRKAITA